MIAEIAAVVSGLGGLGAAGFLAQKWMDRVDKTVEAHGVKIDDLKDEVSKKLTEQSLHITEHLAQETVFVSRLESMEKKLPNGQLDKILARLDDIAPAKKIVRKKKR